MIFVIWNRHDSLIAMVESPTSILAENATVILQILMNHSRDVDYIMRESTLTSGALLKHIYHAIFSPNEGQRVLSRYICGMCIGDSENSAERQLLVRMFPSGFFSYLKLPPLSLEEEDQLDSLEKTEKEEGVYECAGGAGTNIVRFRLHIKMIESSLSKSRSETPRKTRANYRIFFHVLTQDHSLPDLIWNENTRNDLKTALLSEMQFIKIETEARGDAKAIAWNHEQYSVHYASLENELKVGSIYMRLWLLANDSFIKTWEDPVRLFELLFRRFLCDVDQNTVVSIQFFCYYIFLKSFFHTSNGACFNFRLQICV